MKTLILIGAVMFSGCGRTTTYELKAISEKCGGIEKVHELWVENSIPHTTKAICMDGTIVGGDG